MKHDFLKICKVKHIHGRNIIWKLLCLVAPYFLLNQIETLWPNFKVFYQLSLHLLKIYLLPDESDMHYKSQLTSTLLHACFYHFLPWEYTALLYQHLLSPLFLSDGFHNIHHCLHPNEGKIVGLKEILSFIFH